MDFSKTGSQIHQAFEIVLKVPFYRYFFKDVFFVKVRLFVLGVKVDLSKEVESVVFPEPGVSQILEKAKSGGDEKKLVFATVVGFF